MISAASRNELALFGCCAYTTAVAGQSGCTAFRLALVVLEDKEVIFVQTPWCGGLLIWLYIAPRTDRVAGFHLGAVKAGHRGIVGTSAGGVFQEVGSEALGTSAKAGPAEHGHDICKNNKNNSYSEYTPAHFFLMLSLYNSEEMFLRAAGLMFNV